ncbi:hypothetical protein [Micromonospora sp. NPDC007230]|uniref:hypothetical protein n=1 Tax=Micromonospora sp. NPDC007230 TaxID=3364237 RepID=UPI00369DFFD2
MIDMFTYINVNRRLVMIASLALVLAATLVAGQDALAALAEGYGWGAPPPASPVTQVVADGYGWGAPLPASPHTGA